MPAPRTGSQTVKSSTERRYIYMGLQRPVGRASARRQRGVGQRNLLAAARVTPLTTICLAGPVDERCWSLARPVQCPAADGFLTDRPMPSSIDNYLGVHAAALKL